MDIVIIQKAAMEKAAMEKAAMEKAAMEKAAMEKAAMEKAAMEKAATENISGQPKITDTISSSPVDNVLSVTIFSANDWFHIAELNFYNESGKLIPKTNYIFRQQPKDFYTEGNKKYVFDNINDMNINTFFHSATQKPIIIEVLFNMMGQKVSAVEIWNRRDSPNILQKRIVGTTVGISSMNWNAVYRIDRAAPGYIFIPPFISFGLDKTITNFMPMFEYKKLLKMNAERQTFVMYYPLSVNLTNLSGMARSAFTGLESPIIPPNILYLFILLIILAVVYYLYSKKNKSIYSESKDDSLT